jgi:chromosomal replication initiator protein
MGAAEQPGRSYNPFFLHGNVGVGKTHLLQGLCHMILQRSPQSRILYLSCETFINHFISALQDGDTTRFRNKYRNVDVLVVDDIHLLANKERTQEEFFHTFNTLYNAGKQIVLSSDSPPKDIPTLQERLVSRFKWGMVTEIEPPCFETRMAIVKRKSIGRGQEFPPSVAEYIASNIENNVRELEGAVTRLIAFSSMSNRTIDHAMAHEALSSILKTTRGQPTLGDVVQAVTQHYHLKPSDLQSSKRTRAVAFPRHVAMYLARIVTGNSFEAIGAHFGGRDHSTVVYAVNKMKKITQTNPEICEEVGRLYTELTGRQLEA